MGDILEKALRVASVSIVCPRGAKVVCNRFLAGDG